jgi:catechol 2,3-dioxygenase-like lactoylglutathione lyase family enzyme
MSDAIRPSSLDHVALWTDARKPLADFLCDHLGMHVIEEQDDFTLVGVDALEGKRTLFDAEGPRDPGILERIVLRVADLDAAVDALPAELDVQRTGEIAAFTAPDGLGLGLVAGGGIDYDLDHVVLRVPEPEAAARELADLGFAERDGSLAVADRRVRLEAGEAGPADRPLLNHLALLVPSAQDVKDEAERRGLEIQKVVDAANTIAVFVNGPQGIVVEYVEHKPGFSLR